MFVNASAAEALAPRALPALNPNQPNQSSPAPSSVKGTLCGRMAWRAKSLRGASTSAATRAAAAALTCTTVPPAKSRAPKRDSHPPPQTQWATGAYTAMPQRKRKARYGPKRIRSTMAPEISAAVMIAKVPW